jgi:hypothetical protein
MSELTIALAGILTTAGTGYLSYLFARSRYIQEVEKLKVEVLQGQKQTETTSIENDIKLSAHYKDILSDLKLRYEKRCEDFEKTMNHLVQLKDKQIAMLEQELKLKDRKIKLQQQEISELKRENKLLKNENNSTK